MSGAIRPLHHSVLELMGYRKVPKGMEKVAMDAPTRETCETIAIDVFTDMVNAGHSFQAALGSIYLSGLKHAESIINEKKKGTAANDKA